jgi:hypothetical protein
VESELVPNILARIWPKVKLTVSSYSRSVIQIWPPARGSWHAALTSENHHCDQVYLADYPPQLYTVLSFFGGIILIRLLKPLRFEVFSSALLIALKSPDADLWIAP